MKKILILLLLILPFAGCLAQDEPPIPEQTVADFENAPWQWKQIRPGIEYAACSLRLFDSPKHIAVVRYDIKSFKTDIVNVDGKDAAVTSDFAEKHNALAAINGSYFAMGTRDAITFVIDEWKKEAVNDDEIRADGAVAVKGRKIVIALSDSLEFEKTFRGCRDVLAAGPVLLLDGKSVPYSPSGVSYYVKRHPRSLFGTDNKGRAYMIVIDGRFKDVAEGVTLPECVTICRLFNIKNAINLDGGGSSTLWVAEDGVISHPCDNKKFDSLGERKVPNVILVKVR